MARWSFGLLMVIFRGISRSTRALKMSLRLWKYSGASAGSFAKGRQWGNCLLSNSTFLTNRHYVSCFKASFSSWCVAPLSNAGYRTPLRTTGSLLSYLALIWSLGHLGAFDCRNPSVSFAQAQLAFKFPPFGVWDLLEIWGCRDWRS